MVGLLVMGHEKFDAGYEVRAGVSAIAHIAYQSWIVCDHSSKLGPWHAGGSQEVLYFSQQHGGAPLSFGRRTVSVRLLGICSHIRPFLFRKNPMVFH
ncbi:hypothetical protein [Novosphingobium umbonatum]|uniref:hypothetical protein n=1 Tax=Novosphingobium umbonatum TaxID=1908524 RepID=UPI0013E2DE2F